MDTKEKKGSTATAQRPRRPRTATDNQSGEKPARKKTESQQRPLQDVVYIPPKPFMRNRILLRLASVAAIVLAVVLAMFVFFKVEEIHVSGADQYTAWDISQASGIEEGDSLFSLELPGAAARIKALPYVKDVRIGIKLPNKVVIEITEVRVTYAVKAQDETWWLMDSSGKIIEKASENAQEEHTKILGIHLLNPKVGQQAVAQETSDSMTVTAAKQLSISLFIADQLEANRIIGQKGSIDVNDLGNLQVWYGDQYQIKLGNEEELARKINLAKGAIDSLSTEYSSSGVLDATLTVDKTGVRYNGFQ